MKISNTLPNCGFIIPTAYLFVESSITEIETLEVFGRFAVDML